MGKKQKYDIVIIGAGVVGAMVARSLSVYDVSICLIDRHIDAAMGASGANSGIVHAGYDAVPGSLKSRFNVEGTRMMQDVCEKLGVPYKNTGSFVIAFNEADVGKLNELYENGISAGVSDMSMISGDEARALEPALSKNVVKALYAKTAGIVSPYKLNISSVENAVVNGVDFLRQTKVTGIKGQLDNFTLETDRGPVKSRVIVNCAGIYADEIAKMAGDGFFKLIPRRGEYMLFDRSEGYLVDRVIFQTPSEEGKGVLVMTTVDGNLLVGPDANIAESKEDSSTHSKNLDFVYQTALKSCGGIKLNKVITTFAGLRATPDTGDFIIGESDKVPGFYNVAGIESPGLSSAPAIAEFVAGMVAAGIGGPDKKKEYTLSLEHNGFFRDMTESEMQAAIKRNPDNGVIVCRCETVTKAEVVDSIRRPAGARTVDGVKRRTRAGMGRCQGGFCLPAVIEILSDELNMDKDEILKGDEGSGILTGRTRP